MLAAIPTEKVFLFDGGRFSRKSKLMGLRFLWRFLTSKQKDITAPLNAHHWQGLQQLEPRLLLSADVLINMLPDENLVVDLGGGPLHDAVQHAEPPDTRAMAPASVI